MRKPYIERRHVELEEEVEVIYSFEPYEMSLWYARVCGPLVPTKETVRISRSGSTASDALDRLREAVEEQGWELHD